MLEVDVKFTVPQLQQLLVQLKSWGSDSRLTQFVIVLSCLLRRIFPKARVLHILEDHVISWMHQWYIGAGLMVEEWDILVLKLLP